jgi:YjbE family integral membrane protein
MPDAPDLIPLLQIIWIDIVLSDDNALVIAMACRALPKPQRRLAIALGVIAATLMRIAFTLLALPLLSVPFLRIVGGLVLIWIAIGLAAEEEDEDEGKSPISIWESMRIIVVADAIMSLDNVLAVAAAAQGSVALIIFGLALSIPLVIAGAAFVGLALRRFPILVWIGAGILGWVAGDLIAADPALAGLWQAGTPMIAGWHLAAAGAALTLLGSWLRSRRRAAAQAKLEAKSKSS